MFSQRTKSLETLQRKFSLLYIYLIVITVSYHTEKKNEKSQIGINLIKNMKQTAVINIMKNRILLT